MNMTIENVLFGFITISFMMLFGFYIAVKNHLNHKKDEERQNELNKNMVYTGGRFNSSSYNNDGAIFKMIYTTHIYESFLIDEDDESESIIKSIGVNEKFFEYLDKFAYMYHRYENDSLLFKMRFSELDERYLEYGVGQEVHPATYYQIIELAKKFNLKYTEETINVTTCIKIYDTPSIVDIDKK